MCPRARLLQPAAGSRSNALSLDIQLLLGMSAIFVLRLMEVTIGTVRLLVTVQGKRLLAAVLGFFEALIFALATAGVVSMLGNVWNLLAYCGGYAVGTYLGIALEARFATDFVTVTVVSAREAHAITAAIRAAGHGATESWGKGAEGPVGSVRVVVRRQEMRAVLDTIAHVDRTAFVTVSQTRAMYRGYLRPGRPFR
jgi:uncharacterized protein YebE (UPF0316 family)